MDVSPTMGEYIFTNMMGRWMDADWRDWGGVEGKKSYIIIVQRNNKYIKHYSIYSSRQLVHYCSVLYG